jgi:hypothetical protein
LVVLPSQSAKPSVQVTRQTPAAQEGRALVPPAHTVEQVPQREGSEASWASHPLAGLPSQSPKPAAQTKPQRPAAQVAVALGPAAHALPQAPQWARFVRPSTSQPSAGSALQSKKPGAQRKAQRPSAQTAAALVPVGHARPQVAQWEGSAARLASQPLAAMPSQSP